MPLNDIKYKSIKPKDKIFKVSDEKGLLLHDGFHSGFPRFRNRPKNSLSHSQLFLKLRDKAYALLLKSSPPRYLSYHAIQL